MTNPDLLLLEAADDYDDTRTISEPDESPLAVAMRHVNNLEIQLDKVEREIEQAEDQLGDDFAAVADGALVSTVRRDALALLFASKRTLEVMLDRARSALVDAKNEAVRQGVELKKRQMLALLATRKELGETVDGKLGEVAELLRELQANGRAVIEEFRSVRGNNTLTERGIVVTELGALAQGEHLQHLANLDLHRRLQWWRYDMTPLYGCPTFAEGINGASGAFESNLDELYLVDLEGFGRGGDL